MRTKANTWILFSIIRVLLFIVPLGVLVWSGVDVWLSTAVAALFGLAASFVFLNRQRQHMARDIQSTRSRTDDPSPAIDADTAVEDGLLATHVKPQVSVKPGETASQSTAADLATTDLEKENQP